MSMGEVDENVARWAEHFDAVSLAEAELPAYCLRQRWYPAKDAGTPTLTLSSIVPLQELPGAALAIWTTTVNGRAPFKLFIPLAVLPAGGHAGPIIGTLKDGRLLIDATESDAFIEGLVQRMLTGSLQSPGALHAGHTEGAKALRDLPTSQWRIKRSTIEQSNTSIRVADSSILKIIRKIAPGIHPELEMSSFLTGDAHFSATPALLGWLNLDENTVAVLQEFIPNQGDGWSWIRARLHEEGLESDTVRAWLATLGRRTAELHAALEAPSTNAAFQTEMATKSDWHRWAEDLSKMAERVRQSLSNSRSEFDNHTQRLAETFERSTQDLGRWLASVLEEPPTWQKTRHHGDYHLGQVLVRGKDAVIVDFEGEPLRPLAERRAKHIALRDVAGMLRSLQYVSATLQGEMSGKRTVGDRAKVVAELNDWTDRAQRTFLDAYLTRFRECISRPLDVAIATRIVQFFLIEKALYEVIYELANRPAWVWVPLQGVISALAELKLQAAETSPIRRRHPMPFGAETLTNGGVRFRVWAPKCAGISISIQAGDGSSKRTVKMTPAEQGWHERTDAEAGAGNLYEYLLPDGTRVPDPASRFQPGDVSGPSEVVEPTDFAWSSTWKGRAWEEAVIYELHVGTFTSAGTFLGVIERLDHLCALGVTAIELMPIADFPGQRNWGYDGVLWYAPDSSYGLPEDLKTLVEAAHALGIMVLLDVVYNHFGPDGNFLPSYAPAFFTDRHKTPWGAAVNFDGSHARTVREFVIQNALYWLEEYNLDGLRLDAVHAILDDSPKHLLEELAQRARAGSTRPIHLLLENEENAARWLSRDHTGTPLNYSAQWNDDVHHVLHVAATGESQGYYADYAGQTEKLGRALAEGFAYQGETMPYSGKARGEASAALPPAAFVAFIQNHDQVGNRAFGDRLHHAGRSEALRAIAAVYLLLPQIPMIFMGEEWGSQQPFPFFCDFPGSLGEAVRNGRRQEFAKFPEFQDEANRERIPDPQAESTFLSAKLHWQDLDEPAHAAWFDYYRRLLAVRRAHIVPILREIRRGGMFEALGDAAVKVSWPLEAGGLLIVEANLSAAAVQGVSETAEGVLWTEGSVKNGELSPWSVRWSLTGGNTS
jgi:malto-oligosyltrehalose trehalohydrolase